MPGLALLNVPTALLASEGGGGGMHFPPIDHIVKWPAWFGEGSVIKGEPRQYDLVALRETRLALMNRATFLWLFEHSAAFNRFLVHQFNERLAQFISLAETERTLDSTGRLARNLAWLFNPILYPDLGRTPLAWLRGFPEAPSAGNLNDILERLDRIRRVALRPALADAIHENRFRQFVREGAVAPAFLLSDYGPRRRRARQRDTEGGGIHVRHTNYN